MSRTTSEAHSEDEPGSGRCLMVVHSKQSDTGRMGASLRARGYSLERCCPNEGDELPRSTRDYAAIVVFGGPMSANDDAVLPGIKAELVWLETVLRDETRFLGICLGAQLLARALGSEVKPHPHARVEVGYYPVESCQVAEPWFDGKMHAYQWHKEGFDLPSGTTLLASGGDDFPNQAFRASPAVHGVQFHPEVTLAMLKEWCGGESTAKAAPGAQDPQTQLAGHARHDKALGDWLNNFLDHWLAQPVSQEWSRVPRGSVHNEQLTQRTAR